MRIPALLAAVTIIAAPRAARADFELHAGFVHGSSFGAYHTQIDGRAAIDFGAVIPGQLAELAFDVEAPASALAMRWFRTSDSVTGPVEVWLTAAGIGAGDLDLFLSGAPAPDPTLVVPVERYTPEGGAEGTWWRNRDAVTGQIFFRGCGSGGIHKYADLTFDPQTLFVQELPALLSITADAPRLTGVDALSWYLVLNVCGGATRGLPPAQDGLGVTFSASGARDGGGTQPPAPNGEILSLEALAAGVGALVDGGALAARDGRALTRLVRRSERGLRRGSARVALESLDRFGDRVVGLVQTGGITPADAAALGGAASEVQAAIEAKLAEPAAAEPFPDAFCRPPDPMPVCAGAGACSYTVLHVRAGARGGDGSAARPFARIGEAYAASAGSCGVEIRLDGGSFTEDLTAERHVRLIGTGRARATIRGSIADFGGATVELVHVRLIGSTSPLGAVHASHPCARVIVRDSAVADAGHFGVRQRGGALTLLDSSVSVTRATDAADRLSGAGVVASCGARVTLWGASLVGNTSAGVVAIGAGTRVEAVNLAVIATGVHPMFAAGAPPGTAWGFGAVQAIGESRISAAFFSITDNTGLGVLATYGGEIVLRSGQVVRTRGITEAQVGAGLGAIERGHVDGSGFESRDNATAGVVIYPGGAMDLSYGVIANQPIGAHVSAAGFDLRRIGDHVVFTGNETNLDSSVLPTPEPAPAGLLSE